MRTMDKAEKKEIRARLNQIMCRTQERIAYCDMIGDGPSKQSESDLYELAWILMQIVKNEKPDSHASLGMTKTEQEDKLWRNLW